MNEHLTLPALFLSFTVFLGISHLAGAQPQPAAVQAQNKALVLDFIQNGLEKNDPAVVTKLVAENMIQHSPGGQDGRAGLLALLKALPEPMNYRVSRVIAEDDLVVVHSYLKLSGRQNIAFDVFRVANGQIAEHWDVLQPNSLNAKNLSGHGALDGPTAITDLAKTAANKDMVTRFYTDVLTNHKLDTMNSYFDGDTYIQHNTGAGDSVPFLRNVLLGGAGFTLKIDRIARVVAEGNYVFVHSSGTIDGVATVFGDLYRVENGKVTEHWDSVQPVPEQSANNNGML